MTSTARHLVLAGDSVFDNDGYVPGEAGVIEQLRRSLPHGWSGTKVAVDGDCVMHVTNQLVSVPAGATDLIVSAGGNDARAHSALLSKVEDTEHLNRLILEPLADFRINYRRMLGALRKTGLRIHVCTIYTAIPFKDPVWRQFAPAAIKMFNEIIIAEARAHAVSVIRLDHACVDDDDFSVVSPIEPSNRGGQKIVDCILSTLSGLPV